MTLNRSALAAPPSYDGEWHFCGEIDGGRPTDGRATVVFAAMPSEGCNDCGDGGAAAAAPRAVRPDGADDGPPCMARNVSLDGLQCRPCDDDPGSMENDGFDDAVHPDPDQQHQQRPPLGGGNDDPRDGRAGESAEDGGEDDTGFDSDGEGSGEDEDGLSESDGEDSEAEESDAEDHQLQASPWGQEYETDEDGSDDEQCYEDGSGSDEDEDDDGQCYDSDGPSSRAGTPCHGRRRRPSDHALFLPAELSPSVESLKYDSDDDESDHRGYGGRGSGFGGRHSGYGRMGGRAYMLGPPPRRPRLWDACPQITSVSSGSSSEDSSGDESTTSTASGKRRRDSSGSDDPSGAAAKRRGVTFNPRVVVNPIFATEAYDPSMLDSMYTPRDELRRAKLRNKREYLYDSSDWRNATEEWAMERDESSGELVHPAHLDGPPGMRAVAGGGSRVAVARAAVRTRVVTYSSAGGYADETLAEDDDEEEEGAVSGGPFDGDLDDGEEATEAAVDAYYDEAEGDEDDGSALRAAKRMRMCWS